MAVHFRREHANMSQSKSHDAITLSIQFPIIKLIHQNIQYMLRHTYASPRQKNLAHRTFSQPRVGEEDTTTGWAFGSMQNSLFDELCQNECLYHQSVLFDMYVLFQAFTNENLARSITNL